MQLKYNVLALINLTLFETIYQAVESKCEILNIINILLSTFYECFRFEVEKHNIDAT